MKFRFTPDKGKNIGFTQDDLDDYEVAKQRVANLLDDPAWRWLRLKIDADRLSWPEIFDLISANS